MEQWCSAHGGVHAAAGSLASRSSACRAPHQSPVAGRVTDALQGGHGGGLRGQPEGREVRRELRQHLSVQGAVEQRCREQRGAASTARTVAVVSSSSRPVAQSTASQPAEHVVAQRCQPRSATDEVVHRRQCRDAQEEALRAASPASCGGGVAPPQVPGSPPGMGTCRLRSGAREHPRIFRPAGGCRSDTGSRAQHRGWSRRQRGPPVATRAARTELVRRRGPPRRRSGRPLRRTTPGACGAAPAPVRRGVFRRWSTTRCGALTLVTTGDHASRRYRPRLHLPM